MFSTLNRPNQINKLMVNSLILILALAFNNWNDHSLTTANFYPKTRVIHIPYINCLNLVLSLCTLKSPKELMNVFNIHDLLSLRLNWLFFNNRVLWTGFKRARRPIFTNYT